MKITSTYENILSIICVQGIKPSDVSAAIALNATYIPLINYNPSITSASNTSIFSLGFRALIKIDKSCRIYNLDILHKGFNSPRVLSKRDIGVSFKSSICNCVTKASLARGNITQLRFHRQTAVICAR